MTQTDAILEHLKRGEPITPLDALNRYGCFRLGARIKDLRDAGHNIVTKMVHNNGKMWAKYYIPQPVSQLEMAI